MAQIIKHRRGLIGGVKNLTARNGELIIASGSISDLSGPFVFIGSPNVVDEGVAGAFNSVSKLYTGTAAPTITAATYGSALDGTPYYASGNKSLYILNNSNVGNTQVDLTGNIEGNTISGVTINNLQSTNVTASYVSASFVGDASGLYNIPATGVTGLNLSKIYSGSVQVTTDAVSGDIHIDADNGVYVSGSTINLNGETNITGTIHIGDNTVAQIYKDGALYVEDHDNGVTIQSDNYAELQSSNAWLWAEGSSAYVEGGTYTRISTDSGNVDISSYDGGTLNLNTDGGEGDVNVLNSANDLYINSLSGSWSFKKEGDVSFPVIPTNGRTGNGEGLLFKKSGYQKVISTEAGTVSSPDVERMVIAGGDSYNTGGTYTGEGGDLYLWAGKGNNGGDIKVDGGEAVSGEGGTVKVRGGYSLNGNGGFVEISAGDSSNAIGGDVNIYAGTGTSNGVVNIHGNTLVTGSLYVTDGAAFIDQGVVSQNSNVLLTSGSSLIIKDGGNANIAGNVYITGSETVDYIQGYTHQWNYLALNGGADGAPDVELSSAGDISLWAEGGTVNVTGSLKVTGDIVFSGSINLGDFTGDTINFNGEVSSSILPSTGSSFDLGSSGQTWNNVWAENAHFTNISIGGITLDSLALPGDLTVSGTTQFSGSVGVSSLTEGRVVTVGANGSLVDSDLFNWNTGSNQLGISGSIKLNGSGYIYNDGQLYLEDITNGVRVQGNDNHLTLDNNGYANLYANGAIDIEANTGPLWLWTNNDNVNISSYDGNQLRLNYDGGEGNVRIGNGSNDLYINSTTYVDTIWDYSNSNNYLQLHGYNTNDNYWWESGNGADTTLLNSENGNNLNILQTNNGDVNIDATGGSVNLHSLNGFNVTGSLVVSDASGVFNSSLISNNSDLTLSGGSNQHMEDGAHLYFNGVDGDIYYDTNNNELVLYNDANNSIRLDNNANVSDNLYVSGNFYTDTIYGQNANGNYLALNGGPITSGVELESQGYLSLWSEGGVINMTGSVHITNDLDVSGSIYAGGIVNYNGDINNGGIYIDSGNYSEISYNDEEVYIGVDSGGIWATSNSGQNQLTSNAGDTTISANNGYNVNINANSINLSGGTAVTGAFTVSSGSMTSLGGDLYVSGNLQVLGSSTNVNIQSQTVDIGDNIIQVNAYSPFDRYAGLSAYDSGSSGASGSFLWDSTNDYWLIVNANSYTSKVIGTTASTGSTGTEVSLTSGTFPIATASNTIGDSLLTFSGTTLAYNTNKFTVESDTGATAISGNLTLSSAGGDDNGEKTSAVTFRNSDNVLGYVSTTETTNELDGILGYNNSTGVLEFSSLIDGGTY